MVVPLSPELETTLKETARREGVSPESLALNALKERFLAPAAPVTPHDEWERRLLGIATDCGVSLPHSAVSSDEMYE